MTGCVGVFARLEPYRVASAELPVSTRLVDRVAGAIEVVAGRGRWWDAARDAFAHDAAAVVVADPGAAPADAIAELAARVDRPVVLARPLLRADLAAVVVEALADVPQPSAIIVECHADAASLASTVRDALGLARALARSPLSHRSAEWSGARGVALFETGAGIPISLVAAATAGDGPRPRVRLTALGTTLVELDGDQRGIEVSSTDAASRRTLPTRFETPERLALRRAVDAVRGGHDLTDLAELHQDAMLAETITT